MESKYDRLRKLIARNCVDKDLNIPFPSDRKFKKKQVCVKDDEGNVRNIHYGDTRYEDFTEHKDLERRKSFRLRHGCDPVSKLNKASARYWACQDLW